MMRTETRRGKSSSTVTVRRISPLETVEAVIPARLGLVREVLKSLPKPRTARRGGSSRAMEHDFFPLSMRGRVSRPDTFRGDRRLEDEPKHRKLIQGLWRRHSAMVSLAVEVRNIRTLDLTGKKPGASASLDPDEWKKVSATFCDGIAGKNVEAAVIRITGCIPEEEKQLVFDRLCHQLPPVTVHRISEKSDAAYTKIEVVLFGKDISRRREE